MLPENVSENTFSDHMRSGFLVPYQKRRFLISFSDKIRSGLIVGLNRHKLRLKRHKPRHCQGTID